MNRQCTSWLAWLFFLRLIVVPSDVEGQAVESNSDRTGLAPSIQQMIQQSQAAMVKVVGASAGRVQGATTGFLVSDDGLVLTSQGVYLDGKRTQVILADGTQYDATILRRDRQKQLALLKIPTATPAFFRLADRSIVQQGDWVVAICNAFKVADKDEPISATLGIVSLDTQIEARLSKRDFAYRGQLFLIDAITSNPSAAGGAVLTYDGRLAGMVGKIINSSETNTRLNYAVPSHVLNLFVNGLPTGIDAQNSADSQSAEPKSTKVGELGIDIFRVAGKSSPAYVDRVRRGSVAAQAKLKPDDLIMSIDGQKIANVKDYDAVAKTLVAGVEVLVIYKRGRDIQRARLTPRAKGE